MSDDTPAHERSPLFPVPPRNEELDRAADALWSKTVYAGNPPSLMEPGPELDFWLRMATVVALTVQEATMEVARVRGLLVDICTAAKPFAQAGSELIGVEQRNRAHFIVGRMPPKKMDGPTIKPTDLRTIHMVLKRVMRDAAR